MWQKSHPSYFIVCSGSVARCRSNHRGHSCQVGRVAAALGSPTVTHSSTLPPIVPTWSKTNKQIFPNRTMSPTPSRQHVDRCHGHDPRPMTDLTPACVCIKCPRRFGWTYSSDADSWRGPASLVCALSSQQAKGQMPPLIVLQLRSHTNQRWNMDVCVCEGEKETGKTEGVLVFKVKQGKDKQCGIV